MRRNFCVRRMMYQVEWRELRSASHWDLRNEVGLGFPVLIEWHGKWLGPCLGLRRVRHCSQRLMVGAPNLRHQSIHRLLTPRMISAGETPLSH